MHHKILYTIPLLTTMLNCAFLGDERYDAIEKQETRSEKLALLALINSVGSNSSTVATVFVRARRGTPQSIPDSTSTAIQFDGTDSDTHGFFSQQQPDRLTVQESGTYIANAYASFAANATGYRLFDIRLNGTVAIAGVHLNNVGAASGVSASVSAVRTFAKGDYVSLYAFQNSGGNLNTLETTAGRETPSLTLRRL